MRQGGIRTHSVTINLQNWQRYGSIDGFVTVDQEGIGHGLLGVKSERWAGSLGTGTSVWGGRHTVGGTNYLIDGARACHGIQGIAEILGTALHDLQIRLPQWQLGAVGADRPPYPTASRKPVGGGVWRPRSPARTNYRWQGYRSEGFKPRTVNQQLGWGVEKNPLVEQPGYKTGGDGPGAVEQRREGGAQRSVASLVIRHVLLMAGHSDGAVAEGVNKKPRDGDGSPQPLASYGRDAGTTWDLRTAFGVRLANAWSICAPLGAGSFEIRFVLIAQITGERKGGGGGWDRVATDRRRGAGPLHRLRPSCLDGGQAQFLG